MGYGKGSCALRFEILLFWGSVCVGPGVGTSHHRVTGALGPGPWHQPLWAGEDKVKPDIDLNSEF